MMIVKKSLNSWFKAICFITITCLIIIIVGCESKNVQKSEKNPTPNVQTQDYDSKGVELVAELEKVCGEIKTVMSE